MNHILIIEDEIPIAIGLESLLKFENYSVIICNDGQSGFNTALKLIRMLFYLILIFPL
jgi:DNA-binding response OmpR family regulator